MNVTGKWTTYEVYGEGNEIYQGNGRNWSQMYGCSLEEVWEHEGTKELIDTLEQTVKDYEALL